MLNIILSPAILSPDQHQCCEILISSIDGTRVARQKMIFSLPTDLHGTYPLDAIYFPGMSTQNWFRTGVKLRPKRYTADTNAAAKLNCVLLRNVFRWLIE